MNMTSSRRAALRRAVCCMPVLVTTLAGQQAAPPTTTAANDGRFPRWAMLGIVGALTGYGVGLSYSRIGNDRRAAAGNCTSGGCVTGIMTAGGALVGVMIGRELDQLHEVRYRGSKSLHPTLESVTLGADVGALTVRDSVVAAAGRSGVRFLSSGVAFKATTRRAAGIRGITDIALGSSRGRFALTTGTGVYIFPVDSGPGSMIREGPASAVATIGDTAIFTPGSRVERAPLSADTTREWPGIDVGRRPIAVAADEQRNIIWTITDTALLALGRSGDSLSVLSVVPLPNRPRRVAIDGDLLVLALGEAGIAVFRTTDPASPVAIARWTGARFAYDVSIAHGRIFIAAGPDGLYIVRIDGDRLENLGLARDLGFAATVLSRDSWTYVYDRTTGSVHRMSSTF